MENNTVVLRQIPNDIIKKYNKKLLFKASEVNQISEDLKLILLGLKKINFDILVRQNDEGLEIIAISPSDMIEADDIKKAFNKIIKNTTSMIELVQKHASATSNTNIYLPQDLKQDPLRNIPPTVENGMLLVKDSNELQQLINIQKILNQRNVNLGDQFFEQIKNPNPFLINEEKFLDKKIELIFVEFLSNKIIKAFMVTNSKLDKSPKPIKLDFSEEIIKSKKHLKLVKHSLYNEKNTFVVNGEIKSSYDIKNNTTKIEKILVTEILDFGLKGYDDSNFIWKNNSKQMDMF